MQSVLDVRLRASSDLLLFWMVCAASMMVLYPSVIAWWPDHRDPPCEQESRHQAWLMDRLSVHDARALAVGVRVGLERSPSADDMSSVNRLTGDCTRSSPEAFEPTVSFP